MAHIYLLTSIHLYLKIKNSLYMQKKFFKQKKEARRMLISYCEACIKKVAATLKLTLILITNN